jgi:hypothetical protein
MPQKNSVPGSYQDKGADGSKTLRLPAAPYVSPAGANKTYFEGQGEGGLEL